MDIAIDLDTKIRIHNRDWIVTSIEQRDTINEDGTQVRYTIWLREQAELQDGSMYIDINY